MFLQMGLGRGDEFDGGEFVAREKITLSIFFVGGDRLFRT